MSDEITLHIVGDVHGFAGPFERLLRTLGYGEPPADDPYAWRAPAGCQLISLGDVVDRGPDSLRCLRIMKRMVELGSARMVLGNHEWYVRRLLREVLGLESKPHRIGSSLAMSALQIRSIERAEQVALLAFIDGLPRAIVDEARGLIFVHARWGRGFGSLDDDGRLAACVYGHTPADLEMPPPTGAPLVTTGRSPVVEYVDGDLPMRAAWAPRWNGPETIFWGHQNIVPGAVVRVGRTVNMESGCFEGHALSAFVYPEGRVVQAHGSRHWHELHLPYVPAWKQVFPVRIEDVARTIRDERLHLVGDYLAWLEAVCEQQASCSLSSELRSAHENLHARILEAGN